MNKKLFSIGSLLLLVLLGTAGYLFFLHKVPTTPPPTTPEVPHIGSIQILNGCGVPGAGQILADKLRANGFDVKEIANAPDWNYKETIVANRIADTAIAVRVAEVLHTKNLIPLQSDLRIYDVTVFVGSDYMALAAEQP